ncbi:hypothetical protein [Leptospira kanakyensis]|uniref:hypothetical protein n=1 Tax=Leptospira kanakyensis TaxID=2484968 RepID=UPI00223E5604|nr:hypothetical protein [Leptospira kanakyensis]MCW7470768.1 hypothetical protein [Leptospira kanakyensis]
MTDKVPNFHIGFLSNITRIILFEYTKESKISVFPMLIEIQSGIMPRSAPITIHPNACIKVAIDQSFTKRNL